MRIFFGLHKTIDDRWRANRAYINENDGVVVQLDDGTNIIVVRDGRIFISDINGTIKYGTDARSEIVRWDNQYQEEYPAIPSGTNDGDRTSVEDSGEIFDSEILDEQGASDRDLESE